jgi:hypothetical protein
MKIKISTFSKSLTKLLRLYFFSQSHGITEEVKTQRLRWPGYVEGMDERVPKMLMTCEIGGRRRPRKRCKGEVEEDLREIGIIGWRTKAKNTEKWENVTNKPWAGSFRRATLYTGCIKMAHNTA